MKTYRVTMQDGSFSHIEENDSDYAADKAVRFAIELIVGWPMPPNELQNAITVRSIELVGV
jgi:hypothetical protein